MQRQKPNIIIYVIDTLRADRLSVYGHERKTSPNIDKFALESTLYSNAFATSCWTIPTHASLFTGLYPRQHLANQENIRMSDNLTTLAEILKENGYTTTAFINNALIGKNNNFMQGFDFVYEEFRNDKPFFEKILPEDNTLHKTFKDIIFWLKQKRNNESPFFIFINTIEPHSPYDPPEPFRSKFLTGEEKKKDWSHGIEMFAEDLLKVNVLNEDWQDVLPKLYDGEISYIDETFGRFLKLLKKTVNLNETFFIVTSDHGESLSQHGFQDHQFHLHDEVIRIPLIIRYPEIFKRNFQEKKLVSLIDIFPTILNVLGIKVPPDRHGNDLISNNTGHPFIMAEYFKPKFVKKYLKSKFPNYEMETKYDRSLVAIRNYSFKLIKASKGREELYEIKKDPLELTNHIENHEFKLQKEKLLKVYNTLDTVVKKGNKIDNKKTKFDEETLKRLKALGYVN